MLKARTEFGKPGERKRPRRILCWSPALPGLRARVMGCAASTPLPEGAAPTIPKAEARALVKKATATPPFPLGHQLLAGFAKALDLEHGDQQEKEAVATWSTLELEARPKTHFEELGTDLQTCVTFVADVERAVKEKCVTIEGLCELWGTPEVKPKPQVVGLAQLGEVNLEKVGAPGEKSRARPTGGDDGDSLDDDDSIDRDLGGEPNTDARPGGDGRY